MKTTYLKDFIDYSKKGIAYFPIGTLEWHGNHLPIETDFLVGDFICRAVSEEISGYVLPPFYLGTDRGREVDGKILNGMDGWLGKELQGSLYYLKPERLEEVVSDLMNNLKKQGFKHIFIISGHGGSKHVEILEEIDKKIKEVHFLDCWECLSDMEVHHADEHETSVFWACYPEERKKSLKMNIPKDDDYFQFKGYDPREKASVEHGQEMLDKMVKSCEKQVKNILKK